MFSDIQISYFSCTHRAIEPSKTIAECKNKLKVAGITRVTDITHLDRIGIPVFSAIRPTAQDGGVSIYAGKGAKKDQAKASAMMEGFERYSAEKQSIDDENSKLATLSEMDGEKFIHPDDLIISNEVKSLDFEKERKIEWTLTKDIITENDYYIPSNAIFHPYIPKDAKNTSAIFKGNTNGLASGNVLEEAVLHGMLEVIERDAWSIFELTKKNKKCINIDNIENPLINELLEKFKKESINIKLMDLTADIDIPTIAAIADDTILKDPALLTLGIGTHLNPEIAVLRALTEVAQSRATQIHGTREDTSRAVLMRKAGYERMKKINKHYFEEENNVIIDLSDIEDKSTDSLKKDIEITTNELKRNNIDKILFKNLTRKEIGINVVRVIIPGTENFSIDPDRVGKRWMKFK
ncbi:methanogenesis marker 1 protein [Methanobrevibacter arboriphilus]|jgi:ribosomal protein S12 methylthiotransferase accessory factor|uniref:Methanogenesis marker 1 protein n=1 Tax=Methanobrevibacter arboriphilus TaxID=39441 RepID=A0ACA8R7G1_METAZ|nr:YcaO-related McrA-glycine thioamidation protein [Methanobrevibacter arboriphilus]BBL62707.1 methanogenesis marker 1 protein [Methanobrevibacter arboriphilus]GLI11946.1 methanogenesis marker 1 protein [Methanobrevibacter arboriphilus]